MPPFRTVQLAQPLQPSPQTAAALLECWQRVLHTQHVITTYLQHRAAGRDVSLLDVVRAHERGAAQLPSLPPEHAPVVVPNVPVDPLSREFRDVRDRLGWTSVPAAAYQHALAETARTWRALGPGTPTTFGALPRPWDHSRDLELHLGNAVQRLDDVTLEVPALGAHALIAGDLYLAPAVYVDALRHRQQRRLAQEAAKLARLERAAFDGGDPEAVQLALALRTRYLTAGVLLDAQVPPPDPPPGAPRCVDRTVIRRVRGRWEVVWTFKVAPGRPAIDDVLGLDVGGGRIVAAYAAEGLRGVIPRPRVGAWDLPEVPAPSRALHGPLAVARARALHRRALYERLRPAYEQLLDLALTFRGVALEDLSWAGLARRGSKYPREALVTGLRGTLDVLIALAPHHHVDINLISPRMTSRRCPECPATRSRPWGGGPFTCNACGYREAVGHVAAARVIRQRALDGLGWSP